MCFNGLEAWLGEACSVGQSPQMIRVFFEPPVSPFFATCATEQLLQELTGLRLYPVLFRNQWLDLLVIF